MSPGSDSGVGYGEPGRTPKFPGARGKGRGKGFEPSTGERGRLAVPPHSIRATLPSVPIVFDWSSQDPSEEVRELTDAEDAGIHAAIESVRDGEGVTLEAAKTRVDRILGR